MNVRLTTTDFWAVSLAKANPVLGLLIPAWAEVRPGPSRGRLLPILLVAFWQVYFRNFDTHPSDEHATRRHSEVVEH